MEKSQFAKVEEVNDACECRMLEIDGRLGERGKLVLGCFLNKGTEVGELFFHFNDFKIWDETLHL